MTTLNLTLVVGGLVLMAGLLSSPLKRSLLFGPLVALAVGMLRPYLVLSPRGRGNALFLGWFGPIGVAALYYATLSTREVKLEEARTVGGLVIRASILVHGVAAASFTKLYGDRPVNAEEHG